MNVHQTGRLLRGLGPDLDTKIRTQSPWRGFIKVEIKSQFNRSTPNEHVDVLIRLILKSRVLLQRLYIYDVD